MLFIYKIVPKNKINYQLLTITRYNKNNNSTYICCFVLIRYEDSISLEKIFSYLHSMYYYNPHIVHIDYSKSLRKPLLTENLFKFKPIIIHCFFHSKYYKKNESLWNNKKK